jgi:hypothetical protein
MGYYLRAFCKKLPVPTVGELFATAERAGIHLALHERSEERDIFERNWEYFSVRYDPTRRPIDVDVTKSHEDLFVGEIDDFRRAVLQIQSSPATHRVLDTIDRTKFIVAIQIFTDITDHGRNAYGLLLQHLIDLCDAMVQADGEGFYEGGRLLLPVK